MSCSTFIDSGLGFGVGGGGGGGVISVGLSMPSLFTVTNTPVTSIGTLTVTFNNVPPKLALLSPTGSTGQPSFRSITAIDLAPTTLPNPNYFLSYDNSGNLLWTTTPGGGGGSPGGVQGSVQTNNGSGGFYGDFNFSYRALSNPAFLVYLNNASAYDYTFYIYQPAVGKDATVIYIRNDNSWGGTQNRGIFIDAPSPTNSFSTGGAYESFTFGQPSAKFQRIVITQQEIYGQNVYIYQSVSSNAGRTGRNLYVQSQYAPGMTRGEPIVEFYNGSQDTDYCNFAVTGYSSSFASVVTTFAVFDTSFSADPGRLGAVSFRVGQNPAPPTLGTIFIPAYGQDNRPLMYLGDPQLNKNLFLATCRGGYQSPGWYHFEVRSTFWGTILGVAEYYIASSFGKTANTGTAVITGQQRSLMYAFPAGSQTYNILFGAGNDLQNVYVLEAWFTSAANNANKTIAATTDGTGTMFSFTEKFDGAYIYLRSMGIVDASNNSIIRWTTVLIYTDVTGANGSIVDYRTTSVNMTNVVLETVTSTNGDLTLVGFTTDSKVKLL